MKEESYITKEKQVFCAFNVWDINCGKAVINAAAQAKKSIILQTSANVYNNIEPREFKQYLTKHAYKKGIDLFFHLDHCNEQSTIFDAINKGWDSVMIDASQYNLNENIKRTQKICKYAHLHHVCVEGEVGQICGVEAEKVSKKGRTADIGDLKRYVENTEIDFVAAAIGNVHGQYIEEPQLRYDIIEEMSMYCKVPFVIHGGSGLPKHILQKLLKYENVKKINFSTEIKQAYAHGIKDVASLFLEGNILTPQEIERIMMSYVEFVVTEKLNII